MCKTSQAWKEVGDPKISEAANTDRREGRAFDLGYEPESSDCMAAHLGAVDLDLVGELSNKVVFQEAMAYMENLLDSNLIIVEIIVSAAVW
ncbi:unnamed protein product [Clonostachys solani]|uniref:Uncharacterized protein n=1 Tax=Clonostachys solani TaxID=160281 RepID=A0A9N9Z7P2_9HYPO|nr:unnamed protein product [Clonostachys solani]